IVELNENKILNFAKKIHNLNFNIFDNELKNLIKDLPLSKSSKYNKIFKKLEEYKDLCDYINALDKKESLSNNEENEEIDFIGETKKINNDYKKIEDIMNKI
ncbi:MAG: hypothetical protein Q9M94_01380, partial [Candidatus Gracilibacteria bacterium]|nr:hypothetical protein [Candidatus Gracilibacteria bacterium]